MALLDLVFRYRTLLGKCDLAIGLSFEEIDEMCDLEAEFAAEERNQAAHRRRFRRSPVAMTALVRGEKYNDHIKITQLSAGGLECRGVPFIEEGERVEIVVDVEEHSYRFSARAVWMRDDGADYRVAFAFEGIPVLVQGSQPSLQPRMATATNKLMTTIYQRLSAAA